MSYRPPSKEARDRRNAKRRSQRAADPAAARERSRQEHANNRDRRNATSYRCALARYGLTPEDKQLMIDNQAGLCAICGGAMDSMNTCVDHCHKTGRVRGLLCQLCNRALGCFEDDATLLASAISYLEAS